MPVTLFLDDATPQNETLLAFEDPSEIVRADVVDEVPRALEQIESLRSHGKHLAGYFSYELGYLLEKRLCPLVWKQRLPLLWFAAFERVGCTHGSDSRTALFNRKKGRAYAGRLAHEWDESAYEKRYRRVFDRIEAGDIYQANLTFRSRFRFLGDPLALYCNLRESSNARYGAYIEDGDRTILSLSPELFFRISPDQKIVTRPMKGTIARGPDRSADGEARHRLATSAKDRAENLMIVDLLRNDLSRLAEKGSVDVRDLFSIETYPTLHQMVSTVTAQLGGAVPVAALLGALFPCGSVTGAPKIRAMEIIRELEESPRGVYCGAIGHFAPDGSALFNVAIRTLTIEDGVGELGVGGGVVHDSVASDEYAECLLKAHFFERARTPIALLETMSATSDGSVVRRDRHLDRLARSATRLGIRWDRSRATEALDAASTGRQGEKTCVRLVLDEAGHIDCTALPLSEGVRGAWTFSISPKRVKSTDALAAHKVSWREHLDEERDRLLRELGCDEVIFLNEKDEVVEGSRTNIFAKRAGTLWTPPLASGCLDGCLRKELLDAGVAKEGPLTVADLVKSDALFLGNSLRGLIPANLVRA